MPCDAGILKIRNKKLCSPITMKTFENDEIPQSDEQIFGRKQKIFEKNLKNKKTFSIDLRKFTEAIINESSVLEEFEDKENVDINAISFNLMRPTMIFDTCQGLPTYQTTKAHGATTT